MSEKSNNDTLSLHHNPDCSIPHMSPKKIEELDQKPKSPIECDQSEEKQSHATRRQSNESDVPPATNDLALSQNISGSSIADKIENESAETSKLLTLEDILDEALAESPDDNESSGQNCNKYQKRLQVLLYDQLKVFRDIVKKNKKVTNLLKMDPEFEKDQFTEQQIGIRNQVFEMIDLNQSMDQVVIIHCNKVIPSRQSSTTNYRGSNLRGISRNGRNNWQILFMNEGTKSYLGTVDNILKAAILYDILAIQAKGLKAKTNFNFNKRELYSFL